MALARRWPTAATCIMPQLVERIETPSGRDRSVQFDPRLRAQLPIRPSLALVRLAVKRRGQRQISGTAWVARVYADLPVEDVAARPAPPRVTRKIAGRARRLEHKNDHAWFAGFAPPNARDRGGGAGRARWSWWSTAAPINEGHGAGYFDQERRTARVRHRHPATPPRPPMARRKCRPANRPRHGHRLRPHVVDGTDVGAGAALISSRCARGASSTGLFCSPWSWPKGWSASTAPPGWMAIYGKRLAWYAIGARALRCSPPPSTTRLWALRVRCLGVCLGLVWVVLRSAASGLALARLGFAWDSAGTGQAVVSSCSVRTLFRAIRRHDPQAVALRDEVACAGACQRCSSSSSRTWERRFCGLGCALDLLQPLPGRASKALGAHRSVFPRRLLVMRFGLRMPEAPAHVSCIPSWTPPELARARQALFADPGKFFGKGYLRRHPNHLQLSARSTGPTLPFAVWSRRVGTFRVSGDAFGVSCF